MTSEIDEKVGLTLAGDFGAWRELQILLEPRIIALARRNLRLRKKGLASSSDDLRDVLVAVLERLAHQDFQNLRQYVEAAATTPDASFQRWLQRAVDFVIREHLRKRFGRAPQPSEQSARAQPSKRDLQSQALRVDDHNHDRALLRTLKTTLRLTAAQIVEYIAQEFTPEEALAIRMFYLDDRDFGEIAGALALDDDKEARRMIRRLTARLRYHFAPADPPKQSTGSEQT